MQTDPSTSPGADPYAGFDAPQPPATQQPMMADAANDPFAQFDKPAAPPPEDTGFHYADTEAGHALQKETQGANESGEELNTLGKYVKQGVSHAGQGSIPDIIHGAVASDVASGLGAAGRGAQALNQGAQIAGLGEIPGLQSFGEYLQNKGLKLNNSVLHRLSKPDLADINGTAAKGDVNFNTMLWDTLQQGAPWVVGGAVGRGSKLVGALGDGVATLIDTSKLDTGAGMVASRGVKMVSAAIKSNADPSGRLAMSMVFANDAAVDAHNEVTQNPATLQTPEAQRMLAEGASPDTIVQWQADKAANDAFLLAFPYIHAISHGRFTPAPAQGAPFLNRLINRVGEGAVQGGAFGGGTKVAENIATDKDNPLEGAGHAAEVNAVVGGLLSPFMGGGENGQPFLQRVRQAVHAKADTLDQHAESVQTTDEKAAAIIKETLAQKAKDLRDLADKTESPDELEKAAGVKVVRNDTTELTDKLGESIKGAANQYLANASDQKDLRIRIKRLETIKAWAADTKRSPQEMMAAIGHVNETGELPDYIEENANGQQGEGSEGAQARGNEAGVGTPDQHEAEAVGDQHPEETRPATDRQEPREEAPVTPRSQAVAFNLREAGIEAPVAGDGRVRVEPGMEQPEAAIDTAAHDAAASPKNDYLPPTAGQIRNGNYRKGKVLFASPQGDVRVNIETPAGATRRSMPGVKPAWSRPMNNAHYGYIPGTHGADGDPLDVIVGRKAADDSLPVYVVHQQVGGAHDELKVVMGAQTRKQAKDMYLRQYPQAMHTSLLPERGGIVEMNRRQFVSWLKGNDHATPVNPLSRQASPKQRETGTFSGGFAHSADHAAIDEALARLNDGHYTQLRRDGDSITGTIPKAKLPWVQHTLGRIEGYDKTQARYENADAESVFRAGRRESGQELRGGEAVAAGEKPPKESVGDEKAKAVKRINAPRLEEGVRAVSPQEVNHVPSRSFDLGKVAERGEDEESMAYINRAIDTLPEQDISKLPKDPHEYFSATGADFMVDPDKIAPARDNPSTAKAIKRMAASAAGKIERREPIPVRVDARGRMYALDGSSSIAAAKALGLKEIPVLVKQAAPGREPWRTPRGFLNDAQNTLLTRTYAELAKVKPQFDESLRNIAASVGGKARLPGLKGRTRAEFKTYHDNGGNVLKLHDILRGSLEVKDGAAMDKAVKALREQYPIVKVTDRYHDDTRVGPDGYRDINLRVRLPSGHIAEVQINTEGMLAAKHVAHHLYGKARLLTTKVKTGTATPGERERLDELNAQQKKIYTAALAADPSLSSFMDSSINWSKSGPEIGTGALPWLKDSKPRPAGPSVPPEQERKSPPTNTNGTSPSYTKNSAPGKSDDLTISSPPSDDTVSQKDKTFNVAQMSWEATPSTKLPQFSYISRATPEDRAELASRIHGVIGDRILKAVGFSPDQVRYGYGGWEGAVNPSAQERVAVEGGRLSGQTKARLDVAAAVYGHLLHQDGVAYHVPLWGGDAHADNGMDVDLGRPLSFAETEELYGRLADTLQQRNGLNPDSAHSVAPIPTPTGVRFLNFTDVPNVDFHAAVQDAMEAMAEAHPELGGTVNMGSFASPDGNLVEGAGDAKDYSSWFAAAGSPDIPRRLVDELGPSVEGIYRQFEQEQTAKGNGPTAAELRRQPEAEPRVKWQPEQLDAHHQAMQAHVSKIVRRIPSAPSVEVLRSDSAGVPSAVKRAMDYIMPGMRPAAAYHDGRIILFSDALTGREHAERVLAEELMGHHGLRRTFGDEALDSLLDSITPSIKDTDAYAKLRQEYGTTYGEEGSPEQQRGLTEEYLAHKALLAGTPKVLSRVVAFVRSWARKAGMVRRWSENDITSLMHGVAENVRQGRTSKYGYETPATTFYDHDGEHVSEYKGAAGRGTFTYHPDDSRTVSFPGEHGEALTAKIRRVPTSHGAMLSIENLEHRAPGDLLKLTRIAGEEGKTGVLFPAWAEADLREAHIPYERDGDTLVAPASLPKPATGARFSVRSEAPEDPDLAEMSDRLIGASEKDMSPWDRFQKMGRDLAIRDERERRAVDFLQSSVDKFASIANIERKLNGGSLLDATQSAYKAGWMSQNVRSVMQSVLKNGAPEYRDGAFRVKPGRKGLLDIEAPLLQMQAKGATRLMELYMMGRRSSQLINQFNRDGTSKEKLMSDADIKAALAIGEKYPQVKQVYEDLQNLRDDILNLAVERGDMDAQTAQTWKDHDYVPYRRIREEQTGGNSILKRTLKITAKHLRGGAQKVESPLEAFHENLYELLDKIYKGEAKRRMLSLTQLAGATETVPLKWKPEDVPMSQIEHHLEDIGLFVGQQANRFSSARLNLTPEQRALWVKFFHIQPPQGPDITSVMQGGKLHYYKVNDPLVLRALESVDHDVPINKVWRLLFGNFRMFFTRLVTANPAFMLRHNTRQLVHTWVQSGENFNPFSHAILGAKEVVKNGPLMQDLMMAGEGGSEYYDSHNVLGNLATDSRNPVIDSGKKLWRAYERIGYVSDQMHRVNMAKQVLDRGGSFAEAAWQAQDLLNFGMHGDSVAMRHLMTAVPFMNARVQGLYRTIRGAAGLDTSRVSRGRAALSFALKASAFMAASQLLAWRNNQDPRYNRLPDEQKDLYWHFFVGDHHFALAKPYELGAIFSTIPDRVVRYAEGLDGSHTFEAAIRRSLETAFRIDPMPDQWGTIAPIMQDIENKDPLTQRPIVPESLADMSPHRQFNAYTSPTMVKVAQHMPEFIPQLSSPVRLKHMIDGYFPSFGLYAAEAADSIARASGHAPPAPAPTTPNQFERVLLGQTYAQPSTDPRNRFTEMVYEDKHNLDTIAHTINQYRQDHDLEGLRRYYMENKNLLHYKGRVMALYKAMDGYSKMEDRIYRSQTMTPDAKREALNHITAQRNKLLDREAPILNLVDSM